jgi:hypothetical protein
VRSLLIHFDLNTILLIVVLLGVFVFRLLRFHIGPKSWTNWFWDESADKKPTPSASKCR